MKAVLAAIGGFMAAAILLVCGGVLAVHLMIVRPAGDNGPAPGSAMADGGSQEGQTLERIAARPPTESQLALARSAVPNATDDEAATAGVDTMQTAAIDPANRTAGGNGGLEGEGAADPAQAEALAAHVEWCAQRYRSYRPRDNSYTPYRGGRSVCVSPFSKDFAKDGISAPPAPGDSYTEGEAVVQQASAGIAAENLAYDDAHLAYCFSRYRSYDPADNTYQPYGGGPRRPCLRD